ncbi:ORF6N domain-containing protein [Desulfobacula toluolica]|uniref:ORF6N domain-containing protein n=1 Tax=Desulfobacula toluolica TaxID=28223 RepID=UPI0006841C2A
MSWQGSAPPYACHKIEGHDLFRILYMDQPVITFKMMDLVHERPDGTARGNFHYNKKRFIENEDFYRVAYEEHRNLIAGINCHRGPETGQRNPMIFLTATGYMLLVKSFTDSKAWTTQKQVAKNYFRTRH